MTGMPTLGRPARPGFVYYGPDQIRGAIGFEDAIKPVSDALADFSRGAGEAPVTVFAPRGRDGDVHVKSAWLPGHAIFIVKVATWFTARAAQGDSPGAGIVAAFDARTGDLRALLEDEHHLSDIRTAAAGALATRFLAVPQATVLGVLGSGVQAYLQSLAAAPSALRERSSRGAQISRSTWSISLGRPAKVPTSW